MLSAIFAVIAMILGLILDIITLPFRLVFALLRGADFEFRRFSRRRRRAVLPARRREPALGSRRQPRSAT